MRTTPHFLLFLTLALLAVFPCARAQDAPPAAAPAPPAEAPPAAPPAEAAPAPPAEAPPAAPPAEAAPPPPPPPPPLTDIRQVQVKVWISETNERGLRDIGARLNYTRFVRGVEQNGSVQEVRSNLLPLDQFGTVTLPAPNAALFGPTLRDDINNAPADGLQDYQGAGVEFSIINTGYGTIEGAMKAVERQSDADLISKPELLVANGQPATIKAGGQVPFQDAQIKPPYPAQLQVVWRDVGVTLGFVPTIMPNDMVQLNLTTLEVSDVNRIENFRGVDLPVFSTRSQTGVVYVPDSTTLVVGGLTSRVVRNTERRVPVLGRVPLLGIPFRSRKADAELRSLLIFVSPTVVDLRAPTPQAENALVFWKDRGTEWLNTPRIESEREAMQAGL